LAVFIRFYHDQPVRIYREALHLHQILQIVSISALEKVPLAELFANNHITTKQFYIPIQLEINGF